MYRILVSGKPPVIVISPTAFGQAPENRGGNLSEMEKSDDKHGSMTVSVENTFENDINYHQSDPFRSVRIRSEFSI